MDDMIRRQDAIDAALQIIGDRAHWKAWAIVAMLKKIGKEEETNDSEGIPEQN